MRDQSRDRRVGAAIFCPVWHESWYGLNDPDRARRASSGRPPSWRRVRRARLLRAGSAGASPSINTSVAAHKSGGGHRTAVGKVRSDRGGRPLRLTNSRRLVAKSERGFGVIRNSPTRLLSVPGKIGPIGGRWGWGRSGPSARCDRKDRPTIDRPPPGPSPPERPRTGHG